GHLLWQGTKAAGEEHEIVLGRQDHRCFRRQCELPISFVVDQPGRRLSLQPLANPALVQSSLVSQVSTSNALTPLQRLIQSQTIAEINHPGHDRTTKKSKDAFGVRLDLLHIDGMRSGSHDASLCDVFMTAR